jgi:hypothetical protein
LATAAQPPAAAASPSAATHASVAGLGAGGSYESEGSWHSQLLE